MEKLLETIRSPDDGFWDTLVVLSLMEGEAATSTLPEPRPSLRRPRRMEPQRPEIRP